MGSSRTWKGWNSSSTTALGPEASHLASLSSSSTTHIVVNVLGLEGLGEDEVGSFSWFCHVANVQQVLAPATEET